MNRVYFYISNDDSVKINSILHEMLWKIENFGLYDGVDRVNICLGGSRSQINDNLLWNKEKYHVIEVGNTYEFDAINMIWEDSQSVDMNVCYIHAKGITRMDNPNTTDWRKYMSHFIIEKWEDRVFNLIDNDCSGVNLGGNREDYKEHPSTWGYEKAPTHYSGNFWWARSSHIKKLTSPKYFWPSNDFKKWRVVPEMWICHLEEAKYHCAWSSGVNHYCERYGEENYK